VRVLFLNDLHDPRIGSSVRQMYQHAERLRALGHEAMVLSATQDEGQAGEELVLGTPVIKAYSDYPVRWRAWVALDNPRVRGAVEEVLKRFRPDVVHSHLVHTHLGYATLTRARAAGAGVVFTAHDVMTFCYQKLTCFHGGEEQGGRLRDYSAYWQKCIPCQRLRFRPGRNAAIRRVMERDVHRLTTVSDELGLVLRANGIRVDRTVHNALKLQAALPAPTAVAAFRERHGLSGKQVVAIGGRLHEQKGVLQLFDMLALLARRFPEVRLLVLGKRDVYDREFAAAARARGIAERIVTTGWLEGEELRCAYAATDVFVTPSICFDTFGLVNLEAMEHGKPVVATAFGGSREVVLDGVTGFVENPFDVEAYAGRIGQLLADPDLRSRLGQAGYLRLRERFTIERLAEEFLGEYERARSAAAGTVSLG